MAKKDSLLTGAEEELRRRFLKGAEIGEEEERERVPTGTRSRIPSTASDSRTSARVDQITLPDELRGKMPFTKEKFLVKENPHLVQWEREVRKFLRKLSPEHEHRVTAVMVFEWATGLNVAELQQLEPKRDPSLSSRVLTWRTDLRKLNQILEFYFGKPYMTWIMGRKVGKAYKVKKGYYIKYHRPMTLTLYAEYAEGVLNP